MSMQTDDDDDDDDGLIDRTVAVDLLSCCLEFKYAMSTLFTYVMFLISPFDDVYRVPHAFLQRSGGSGT